MNPSKLEEIAGVITELRNRGHEIEGFESYQLVYFEFVMFNKIDFQYNLLLIYFSSWTPTPKSSSRSWPTSATR
jgi:hypothetical protein